VIEVLRSETFERWFDHLSDDSAVAKITIRLRRLINGNFGDVAPVGEGVSELRIDYGPGYRIYFVRRGQEIVFLLCGGNKATQTRDIKAAKSLAKELKENDA
jgi:putative addiction module killer protein